MDSMNNDELARVLFKDQPEPTPEEVAEAAAKEIAWKAEREKRARDAEERERTAVQREIETLRQGAVKTLSEADKLEALFKEFPTLRRHEGRWKKVAYYTKDVNARVTDYDLRHNCGCCHDSPLEVWPYLETPMGRVFSEPAMFTVGEKEPVYGGDVPHRGWDAKMREAGIPEKLIERISYHFENDREKARKYADEAYGREKDPTEDEPFI